MALQIEKRPGADWVVYYMDLADNGAKHAMAVFGCADVDDAIGEVMSSFDDPFTIEIVAVLRDGVDLADYRGVK